MQVKNLLLSFCLIIAGISASLSVSAQFYADNKEKIYVQTNHVFYKQGETLFFKLYIVKAQDQTPTHISNVVYTELISPAGTVVQKANFPIRDGYATGSFDFGVEQSGGIYKLRAYTNWMRNENESQFFVKEVTLQKVLAPRILMKLDFPEKGYGAGDMVSAKFSMRNLNDEPIKNHTGKIVVSLGGQTVQTASFKTDATGKALITFQLPTPLNTNDGLLNVQVDYDSFTESISRSIPIVLNKIDLQFMPEGGTLVNGYPATIAFKALNEFGKAADVKGVIKDGAGNIVASFDSYHFGMGRFTLTPQTGSCYKAFITSPANISQVYDLPAASADGVMMQLNKERKNISLTVYSSIARDIKLKVSSRNTNYHLQHLSLKQGYNHVVLAENIFPPGICQFTLFTENDLPLSERLAFLNEDVQLQVKITQGKKQYGPREKVTLNIKTMDENGKPVPSNFSLSVVDDKLWTFADDKQDHILSWLLMSSELKGKIEEPVFYFKKEEPKSIPALDLLMLTQGYRYFDYTEYVVKNSSLQYLPDQDQILSGVIVDANKQPVAGRVFLVNTLNNGKSMEIETGVDGQFFFTNMIPQTTYYLFARPLEGNQPIKIEVVQNGLGFNPAKATALKQAFAKPADIQFATMLTKSAIKPADKKTPATIFPEETDRKTATLNEVVVVTAFGTTARSKQLGYSTTFIRANDIAPGLKLQTGLEGRVAGLQVVTANTGVLADTRINLRGIRSLTANNEPLYVVNGLPMENLNLDQLSVADINSITVLKDGAATAIYGSVAANGAIVIETKRSYRGKIAFNITDKHRYASQLVITQKNNFSPAKSFYVPAYKTPLTEERTDFRETIYWNPVVQTDKEGKAAIEFYNSDASTTFRAIAEGIGYNGKLGRTEATYSVTAPIQADVKIPPYLTVGDKALLPLVIRNNSEDEQEITVVVNAPEQIKIGSYAQTMLVKAGASEKWLIPVEALGAVKGDMGFTISSDISKETVHLPIEAADKGFPVRLNYSGNTNAEHAFEIRDCVPGTIKAQLKLFNNPEGSLLDGIASMLREPYGCFEQTSSSTYPNIMILKYLKESGKSNPEIEKKALDLIQRGYNRLIGFETQVNGFEWFGNTPPHEALTAYGLLEFTDMQEFIDVDAKMLERTKKFLLKRRTGSGTFEMVNRGYDQFASVPNKIANIYIVYAMVRAGFGKEIKLEYETAVKSALASNDGYQLAMMANAAHLQKDMQAYQQLLSSLAALESKSALNAETSVVNSRAASLRVETYALYAMALLKADKPDLMKVSSFINKILNEKSYYGYGSTQSTVMALQAIVDFARFTGNPGEASPVTFTVNKKQVLEYSQVKELIAPGANTIQVSYDGNRHAVPYGIELSYNTFTPPSDPGAELKLKTTLGSTTVNTGETVRMTITVSNSMEIMQPMAIAKIGIPAGLSAQPWQLKEIMEKKKAAYYEIFDNYLVFYWMGFAPFEVKTIELDLKAEVPGTYRAKASNVYLYYTPEYKHWNEGEEIEVNN
ncbi:MAG: TonB-dependent receptor plug domain-containing protein [Bacteroidetes bacterium]|nr:TonB-dependent receptor plug domain-containing protein [Bacteroidota bacterium]